MIEKKMELLDKEKLVVFSNDLLFKMNDCSLGRFKVKLNWIELLDKDKLVVLRNELFPVLINSRLGRYKLRLNYYKYYQLSLSSHF